MSRLREALGEHNLNLISGAMGGKYVTIPLNPSPKFERMFGETLSQMLYLHFSGERIYIPLHPSIVRRRSGDLDRKRIRYMAFKLKKTAWEIASELQTTERAIRYHLRNRRSRNARS